MSENQSLRDTLIDGFTVAGIQGAAINNARFSSAPQFGLLGRNPNAYEVSARLEVKARSEEHLQFLAAADEHEEVVLTAPILNTATQKGLSVRSASWQSKTLWHKKRTTKRVSGLNCGPKFLLRQSAAPAPGMPLRAMEFAADSAGMEETAAANAAITPSFDEVDYRMSVTVIFEIVESN